MDKNLNGEEFININCVLNENTGHNLLKTLAQSDSSSNEEYKKEIMEIKFEIKTKFKEISLLKQKLKRYNTILENSNNLQVDKNESINKSDNSEPNFLNSKNLEKKSNNFNSLNENEVSISIPKINFSQSCISSNGSNNGNNILNTSLGNKQRKTSYNFFYGEMEKKFFNSKLKKDIITKNTEIGKLWRSLPMGKKFEYIQMADIHNQNIRHIKDKYKPGAIEKFFIKKN